MEYDVTWCKHSSKTDLLSIWSSAKYKNTYNHHGHHENRHELQHSWFHWRLDSHWDTFWWSSISDVSVRELLHFIFDAGWVVFNLNLQDRIISIERLRHLKGFKWCKKALVKFKHPKIVFVKVESSVNRNIWKRALVQTLYDAISLISARKNCYWDPKKQSTKRHPVNISFPNN